MRIVKPITITDSNLISSNVPEKDAQVYSKLIGKNLKDRVMVLSNHTIYEAQKQETSAVTISQGSPAIVTWNSHGLANGRMVAFSSSGTLPTGITAGTTYYVINAAQNTFQVSTKEPFFTRASVGTYFDANGVLQTAPVNAIRVSYDPSDLTAPSNVLIEQAATNIQPYSSSLSSATGWGRANATVLEDSSTSPSNTVTADTWAVTANGASTIAGVSVSIVSGSNVTVSRYVKKLVGMDWVFIGLRAPDFQHEAGVFLNIVNGQIGDVQTLAGTQVAYIAGSAKVELGQSGWCRVSAQFSTINSTSVMHTMRAARINGNINSPISGDSYLVWGAMTATNGLSSYIETTNAAVTRAADIASDTPSYGTAVGTSTAGSGTHTAIALVNNLDPVLNPTYWLNVGSTNRWKMFDKAVQSQTVATGTLTTKIKPSERVDTIPLINLKGTTLNVMVTNPSYGTVINKDVPLLTDSEPVVDLSSYLYAGFTQRTEVVIEDIPPYSNNEITLSIYSPNNAEVGIGAAVFGQARDISSTGLGVEQGARFGIDDYSIKTRDAFGNYVITERAFSDKANVTVFVNNNELSSIKNFLTSLRATPVVFIGSKKWDYLTIYGFYKNWEVDVAYPDFSVLSMEVSGLT